MEYKRLTLFCGHYGSGKTNIAVNVALSLKKTCEKVAIADLDIVNPYFRTKDRQKELQDAGITLICSEFANSNVDFPAMPQELYAITDDRSYTAVLDIGGDERGALALGRLSPMIVEENDYQMLLVINKFRPLTPDAESVMEVMAEIEAACHIPFTGIVNNSNLGDETTADVVLSSIKYAEDVSKLTGLPVVMTAVSDTLYGELEGKIPNLFPIKTSKLLDNIERL